MKDSSKMFAISSVMCFTLGIGFFLYFRFLEYQARQKLPAEMRTPDNIQSVYDGAVCLSCDISGIVLLTLFSAVGIFIILIWAIYEAFLVKRKIVS